MILVPNVKFFFADASSFSVISHLYFLFPVTLILLLRSIWLGKNCKIQHTTVASSHHFIYLEISGWVHFCFWLVCFTQHMWFIFPMSSLCFHNYPRSWTGEWHVAGGCGWFPVVLVTVLLIAGCLKTVYFSFVNYLFCLLTVCESFFLSLELGCKSQHVSFPQGSYSELSFIGWLSSSFKPEEFPTCIV